ncbi:MAG: hypothetical protein ACYC27_18320 [Armatimonadota bacterium]
MELKMYVLIPLFVLYSATEIFCLLFGYGIIPPTMLIRGLASGCMSSGIFFGGIIESMIYSCFITDEKKLVIPYVRGMIMYFIPVTMAYSGVMSKWQLIPSMVLYIVLMARVVWQLTKNPVRQEE